MGYDAATLHAGISELFGSWRDEVRHLHPQLRPKMVVTSNAAFAMLASLGWLAHPAGDEAVIVACAEVVDGTLSLTSDFSWDDGRSVSVGPELSVPFAGWGSVEGGCLDWLVRLSAFLSSNRAVIHSHLRDLASRVVDGEFVGGELFAAKPR